MTRNQTAKVTCNNRFSFHRSPRRFYGLRIAVCFILGVATIPGGAAAQTGGVLEGDSVDADRPSNDLYRRISNDLVDEAIQLERGRPGYWELIDRAWMIDADNGDALFLASQRYIEEQERQRLAEAFLRKALTTERRVISDREIVAHLSQLFLRQGRYREARVLIEDYFRRNEGTLPLHPTIYPRIGEFRQIEKAEQRSTTLDDQLDKLYLQAILRDGSPWLGSAYLQRHRETYPEDAALAAIDYNRYPRVSLSFLEWLDQRVVQSKEQDLPPEIILHALIDLSDPELAEPLAILYRSIGGEDPLVDIFLTTEGQYSESLRHDKFALELAQQWGGTDVLDSIIGDGAGGETLTLDTDRDGFWEERYRVENGEVLEWEEDIYQDGVIDRIVEFSRPQGTTVVYQGSQSLRSPGPTDTSKQELLIQKIVYAPYPQVVEVVRIELTIPDLIEARSTSEPPEYDVHRAQRWQPPRPRTLPLIEYVDQDGNGQEWRVYVDRISIVSDAFSPFQRQFQGENVRILDSREIAEYLTEIRERSLIPR